MLMKVVHLKRFSSGLISQCLLPDEKASHALLYMVDSCNV